MEQKYIVFDDITALVFPKHVTHSDVRIRGMQPESAGFVYFKHHPLLDDLIPFAFGKSESLKLVSKETDSLTIYRSAGHYISLEDFKKLQEEAE